MRECSGKLFLDLRSLRVCWMRTQSPCTRTKYVHEYLSTSTSSGFGALLFIYSFDPWIADLDDLTGGFWATRWQAWSGVEFQTLAWHVAGDDYSPVAARLDLYLELNYTKEWKSLTTSLSKERTSTLQFFIHESVYKLSVQLNLVSIASWNKSEQSKTKTPASACLCFNLQLSSLE